MGKAMKAKEVALKNQKAASIHAAIARRHYLNRDFRSAVMHQIISGDYYAIAREAAHMASFDPEADWGDLGPCERRYFRTNFNDEELLDLMEDIMDRFHDHPHFEVLVSSSSRDEDDHRIVNLTVTIEPLEDTLKS